jgi:hypothetical protein
MTGGDGDDNNDTQSQGLSRTRGYFFGTCTSSFGREPKGRNEGHSLLGNHFRRFCERPFQE